jgi:hypothetical protein
VPKGGGIIQDIWWMNWTLEAPRYGLVWDPDKDIRDFPQMEIVVGSIDTALGEKEENDYSAMTVWGVWLDRAKNRCAMMLPGLSACRSMAATKPVGRVILRLQERSPAIPRSVQKDVVESTACKPGFSDRTPIEIPMQAKQEPTALWLQWMGCFGQAVPEETNMQITDNEEELSLLDYFAGGVPALVSFTLEIQDLSNLLERALAERALGYFAILMQL